MYNILVTGVGAIIGYGIIRSLRNSRYKVKIVGIDIYEDAVGQRWCDSFVKAKLTNSIDYKCFLQDVIDKYKIDLVIPGIEQDVMWLANNYDFVNKLPAKIVLNEPDLIQLSEDKWLTHLQLVKNNIPVIKTYIDGDFEELAGLIKCPMLLKPRKSYASKGIFVIHNEDDFNYWKKKMMSEFMVQEIVGDDDSEFTVGVFGLGDGNYSQKIIFNRRLSREGATAKAKLVRNEELSMVVNMMVRIFKPLGPTNFQFRYHDKQYLLLEINPRISSSTSLRTAFGFNEAEMCIEYYLERKIPEPRNVRFGQAIRYIEDWVIYDDCSYC